MQMEQEIRNLLESVQSEYERMHIEKICNDMIEAVLPELYRIRAEKAEIHKRPVVQYITSRVKTPESITYKLIRKKRKVTMEKAAETFNDLAGIRVSARSRMMYTASKRQWKSCRIYRSRR